MRRSDNLSDITAWLDNAGRYPLLPADRVNMIGKQIQSLPEGHPRRKKLVNTLVQHNLRLVPRYVHGFMDRCSHNKWGSPETVDYLQTGALGLVRAAEMFDPTRGYTFSTYANFWIRSFVGRYNLKSMTPVSVAESATRQLLYYKRNGRPENRNDRPEVAKKKIMELARLAGAAYSCVSLNVPSDTGHELIDIIPSQETNEDLKAFSRRIYKAIDEAGITSVGKEILLSNMVHGETLTQIAERLGMSAKDIKKEKDLAIELAKARPEAFGVVNCVGNTAPS